MVHDLSFLFAFVGMVLVVAGGLDNAIAKVRPVPHPFIEAARRAGPMEWRAGTWVVGGAALVSMISRLFG